MSQSARISGVMGRTKASQRESSMKTLRLYAVLAVLGFGVGIASWRALASPEPQIKRPPTAAAIRLRDPDSRIRLSPGFELTQSFLGDQLARAVEQTSAPAVSLAAADFDEDGILDLVSAYDLGGSGAIVLQHGNADAIYPNSMPARERRVRGQFAEAPFMSQAQTLALPSSPQFISAGDFDADGHQDILTCSYDSDSIYLLAGDGHGHFKEPRQISTEGQISAIATGEFGRHDGQTDIAIGVVTDKVAKLLVYQHPEGAFKRKPDVFDLPAPATAIVFGQLDDDALFDLAVACGNELVFIHGHQQIYPWDMITEANVTRPPAQVGMRSLPFTISAMAIGKFSAAGGDSLALLGDDGALRLLERPTPRLTVNKGVSATLLKRVNVPAGSGFNSYRKMTARGATEEELQHARRMITGKQTAEGRQAANEELFVGRPKRSAKRTQVADAKLAVSFYTAPSRINEWRESQLAAGYNFASAAQSHQQNVLVKARISGSDLDDLLIIDKYARQIQIVSQSGGFQSLSKPQMKHQTAASAGGSDLATLSLDGSEPTAVLPMRLGPSALNDLVILREGATSPAIVQPESSTTFTVNTTDDSSNLCDPNGTCTLRGAITAANANPGADTIAFNIPGSGIHTITVLSGLPAITDAVTIDGSTQPGYAGTPVIEITGSALTGGSGVDGLKVRASDCVIRGLNINQFPHHQDPNTSSFIGGNGLTLESLANQPRHTNDIVEGNFLGTDPTGMFDKGNASTGLNIFDSDNATIGGTTPQARNVISGNGNPDEQGVGIEVTHSDSSVFKGNYIGITADGSAKLPNSTGFELSGRLNTVGGDEAGAGNTISGNGEPRTVNGNPVCGGFGGGGSVFIGGGPGDGLNVFILTPANQNTNLTEFNTISGNRIGTDRTGTQPLGNCQWGIDTRPLTETSIGSMAEGGRNVISDNGFFAVNCSYRFQTSLGGGFCIVSGNNIGTDITGTVAMGNDGRNVPPGPFLPASVVTVEAPPGAFASVGAPGGTTPGGSCTGFCNLISGNAPSSALSGAAAFTYGEGLNGIFNSYIGTTRDGTSALPNDSGVSLQGNSYLGSVGLVNGSPNDLTPLGNLISGNHCGGASISAQGDFGNETRAASAKNNLIGTDVTGNNALSNGQENNCFGGLDAFANPYSTTVIGGASKPGERNIISGNHAVSPTYESGALVLNGNVTALGNYIGVAQDGTSPLGNEGNGIWLNPLFTGTIGGTGTGEQNVIRNNGGAGIFVDFFPQFPDEIANADIRANSIFNNAGLGIDLYPTGVNANDAGDADNGADGMQNYPLLEEPTLNGDGTVTVPGRLNSKSGQTYRLDFYSNNPADPTNYGEGQTYIGTTNVTTNAGGNATFSFSSSGPIASNSAIVATATGVEGTSEFSCVAGQCLADVSLKIDDDHDPIEAGSTLTYTLTVANAGPAAAPNVVVTNNLPPANVTFISATPSTGSCNHNGSKVTCSLGTLNKNTNATIHIQVTPTQVGTIKDTATATHDLTDPDPSNNSDEETTEVVNSIIVVNTTGDEPDANPNDNVCDVDPNTPENQCTLRAAIQLANARAGKDAITFNIPGGGVHTIIPQSTLPFITEAVTIDATTQPGYAGSPLIELNGSSAGALVAGFLIQSGDTTIKGFAINRFDGSGIALANSDNNAVEACFIGTDPTGNIAEGNRTAITIGTSSNNRIGGTTSDKRNIISGNGRTGDLFGGVFIAGTPGNSQNNVVQGNYIGTSASGTGALPNIGVGIFVAASNNTIGGSTTLPGTGAGNVLVSDATTNGSAVSIIGVNGDVANNNNVQGNLIGTNAAGTAALGGKVGVLIGGDTANNTPGNNNVIGGISTDLRNVIAGNAIALTSGSSGTTIQNNYLGTDITGNATLANQIGIDIRHSPNNIIRSNVIVGYSIANVSVSFTESTLATIEANRIGVFANGTTAQSTHATYGVAVAGGATQATIGGTTAAQRNIIAGNKYGVFLQGESVSNQAGNNLVQGNYIGTDFSGKAALGNEVGVGLFFSTGNQIGGDQTNARNIISANTPGFGILIAGGDGNNKINANYIGTDVTGAKDLGNTLGIGIYQSSNNAIGAGPTPWIQVISGNKPGGAVVILDSTPPPPPASALFSESQSSTGKAASILKTPQEVLRALLSQLAKTNLGPAETAASQSGNSTPATTTGNKILFNVIGLDSTLTQALPNKPAGIIITSGASNTNIGGNFVSGNDYGILLGNTLPNLPHPHHNVLTGNLIGLGKSPAGKFIPVPNTKVGLLVIESDNNTIGGDPTLPNIICANGEDGIGIESGSTGNIDKGNYVGVTPDGQKMGNGGNGIRIENSPGNTIGGENPGDGNSIGGNGANGIEITTTSQSSPKTSNAARPNGLGDITSIVGNTIGGVANNGGGGAGVAKALGNGLAGILIENTANVDIGKPLANLANMIIGNSGPGIDLQGSGTTFTQIFNNLIGTDSNSMSGLGNGGDGIRIVNASNNTIGGAAGAGNVIGGNLGNGIFVDSASSNLLGGNEIGRCGGGNQSPRAHSQRSSVHPEGFGGDIVPGVVNALAGVSLDNSSNNLIGGLQNLGNLICGNDQQGVFVSGAGSQGNKILDNLIGTNPSNDQVGNLLQGILITNGASQTIVGGTDAGSGNVIAFNGRDGIALDPTAGNGNDIDPNSIHDNVGLGIDLGNTGAPLPNDPGDGDSGPNNLQNFPEMTRVVIDNSGNLSIVYKVDSAPGNSNYGSTGLYIEFFKADANLEGQTFIGSDNYAVANYNSTQLGPAPPGLKQISFGSAANLGVQIGDKIVATATDADNNTSEFTSANVGQVIGFPTAANGNISGTISDSSGVPISGVTINLSGTESRETITDASGKYNFDSVETNGFYTITPSRVDYSFSPTNRSFSLLGAHTYASFTATTTSDHLNAIDTTEFFVRQQYLDFLSREPDPPGFTGWVNTIRNCAANDTSCDRVHVSEMFFRSAEFQERGYFIDRFYSTAFGRKPNFAEFTPDLARVSGFLTTDQLEAAKTAFVNDFIARAQFATQYGSLSNPAYVDALLNTAAVNLSNRQALIDGLNAGTLTRAQVLRQISESPDVYQKYYNRAFVVMEYFGYLRRDPDDLYQSWIDVLNANPADSSHMVEGFVNSTEYRNRFGK
jgi:uncharacterized repeat protein (TIGR01451 family)/CSLREA domain-containing protein